MKKYINRNIILRQKMNSFSTNIKFVNTCFNHFPIEDSENRQTPHQVNDLKYLNFNLKLIGVKSYFLKSGDNSIEKPKANPHFEGYDVEAKF
jgi:hypothetical protein